MTINDTKAGTPGETGEPLSQDEEKELARLENEANHEASQAEGDETPSSESAPGNQTSSDEGNTETESSDAGEGESSDSGKESSEGTPADEEFVKNLSPKAQKRFEKLSRKAKEGEKLRIENERLRAQVNAPRVPDLNLSKPGVKRAGDLPWDGSEGETNGEQVISEEELNARIAKGTTQVIEMRESAKQFFSDVKSVEKDFPELNADHDDYDEDLADRISNWYESIALQRLPSGGLVFKSSAPTFRVFVDEVMGVRTKAGERGKRTVTDSVLRQAARNAVSSPGTSSAEEGGGVVAKIKDPKTSLEEAEVIANKAAKG